MPGQNHADLLHQRIEYAGKRYFVLQDVPMGLKRCFLVLDLEESQPGQPNLQVLFPDGKDTFTNDMPMPKLEKAARRGMHAIYQMGEAQRSALRRKVAQALSGREREVVSAALELLWMTDHSKA